MEIMDEETYLSINGASRFEIGDSALHKNKGRNSDKSWKKIIDRQAKQDHDLIIKREVLRKKYYDLIEKGEIRKPTFIEGLLETANGHEDNESTQAARRILARRGISYARNINS